MGRRSFLTKAGAGLAGTLAAPVVVRAQAPLIKWRLASSFPRSLDTIYGAAETVARRVFAGTNGRFQIQVFAAGELIPAFQVLDAVADGTIELGHSASYYFVGKDPTFAFDTAVPFGLNSRHQTAWMYEGGGLALLRQFFSDYNIYNIPCGNTGAQMGGWYRKEIRTIEDLKGLKLRIGGFAGQVLARVGVLPLQLPGGDIYTSLERGVIDAAEWVGPYDDEKLGLNKIARYYYYPGWWEGGPQLSLYVSQSLWAKLPRDYQNILEAACAEAHVEMQARYDVRNPAALKRLVAGGTLLRPFSREVMLACFKEAFDLYEETAARNPRFRRIYEPWKKFREDQYLWFRVAENAFENFVYDGGK